MVPERTKKVLFFVNGNTAVLVEGQQVPSLQKPWLLVFVDWLEKQGYDPTEFEFWLDRYTYAHVFKTENEWGWLPSLVLDKPTSSML